MSIQQLDSSLGANAPGEFGTSQHSGLDPSLLVPD